MKRPKTGEQVRERERDWWKKKQISTSFFPFSPSLNLSLSTFQPSNLPPRSTSTALQGVLLRRP